MNIDERRQIDPPAAEANVRHISLPDLIVSDYIQISQQVWINAMTVIAFGKIWPRIDYTDRHILHMMLNCLSVDADSFEPEYVSDSTRTGTWQEGMDFINSPA